MTCPNCGADVSSGRYCEFCGSQITAEMLQNQERLNKRGCPDCGSTNIVFQREKQGERRRKRRSSVMRSTIGLCKDCGYTWEVRFRKKKKLSWLKNKTWLWVLGWLYIFPLPLTILLSRKRRMNPVAKYGIIAASWILYISFYIAIGIAAVSSDSATSNNSATAPLEFEMIAGEAGDYGRPLTLNAGTEFEDNTIGYFVPAGTYSVKNIGEYRTQVNVYKNEINVTSEGWEEWADGGCVVLQVGESKEIVVWDGYFLDIFIGSPSKILITKLS